uniref:Uncharacterized protein n=1 Tax=Anguilla anguilla TaxID=7936 RepID=A0A0E9PTA8_ANGAN
MHHCTNNGPYHFITALHGGSSLHIGCEFNPAEQSVLEMWFVGFFKFLLRTQEQNA